MREHTLIGERIVARSPALRPVAKLVPPATSASTAPAPTARRARTLRLGARIIVVCDAADALTSDLPHRPAQPLDAALAELVRCAGTQFDPRVVEAFCAVAADDAGAGVARPSLA
jgi:response regulator RpfG family c-di-GMP phosphodiesterase